LVFWRESKIFMIDFYEAIINSDLLALERLTPEDCVERYKDKFTLLHLAVQNGSPEAVELILKKNLVDVNCRSDGNQTPLHLAILQNRNRLVLMKMLLESGADPNLRDKARETPVHYLIDRKIAEEELREAVSLLLSHGAEIDARNKCKETPLFNACWNGKTDLFAALLLAGGASLDAMTFGSGLTLLHHQAEEGNVNRVGFLLHIDANPDVRDCNQDTPLHLAAKKNHDKVVRILLKYGAEVDPVNSSGFTPLYYAMLQEDTRIASLLLNKGADVNRPSGRRGNTQLHYHAMKGNLAKVEFLLKHGANPNVLNKKGKSPPFYAIEEGHEEIAEMLWNNRAV
jgi:cytohesin